MRRSNVSKEPGLSDILDPEWISRILSAAVCLAAISGSCWLLQLAYGYYQAFIWLDQASGGLYSLLAG